MYTGMKLHAAGYTSLYHNEILAIGSAPVDLKETLEQRKRWAQGAVEVSMLYYLKQFKYQVFIDKC